MAAMNRIDMPSLGKLTPVTDPNQVIGSDLWSPSQFDQRFTRGVRGGLTIFVAPDVTLIPALAVDEVGEGLSYVYEDRIELHTGNGQVERALGQYGADMRWTARSVEALLRLAFKGDDLKLGHIRAGVKDSGHPFRIYGLGSIERD